ncbi:MAG TPA: IS4 family transposase [Pirellulales bacterium]|nr:IS4 family transposase [Pirellulales bacterium]
MSQTERSFGEVHFGDAKLGNQARTKRLVKVADALTRHPGGTLPQKFKDPAALQAMYRLMQRPEVTHGSVLAAHQAQTFRLIERHQGPLLAMSDATELDYGGLESMKALGQIGSGNRRGYVCQNVLIIDPERRQALGLANQILHTRAKTPPGETKEESRRRESRESRLWPEATRPLPGDRKLVVVCDRGGDTFEQLEHEANSGRRFVVRSAKDRKVLAGHAGSGEKQNLHAVARRAKAAGSYIVDVAATTERPARRATVQFSFEAVRLIPPKQPRGDHSQEPLLVWVVRVWESDPPRGAEPLEWFLLTNEPVADAAAGRRVIGWYECRWVVEEYHKAQKTGCDIEHMQFMYESRLEPMIAILSIVALNLLNLRDASRRPDAKTAAASETVAEGYVCVLSAWRHGEARPSWTVHEFFLALARLGGHQNCRQDKRPGWIVLWRGWTTLQLLVTGSRLDHTRKKVG